MSKFLIALPLLLAFFMAPSFSAETTLTGKITCAKCDLKTATACQTVIVVKDNGKDVIYQFTGSTGAKYHKDICTTPMEGSVTGDVSKEGEKNLIKVTKVEFKK